MTNKCLVYNDNCLTVLDDFIKHEVTFDCIVTSPPYNMNLRVQSGKYMSRWGWKGNAGCFSTKYENYKDDLPMEEYYEFQKSFIEKALKISPIMFYNIQVITGNKVALFKLLGYFSEYIKEVIIWNKCSSQPAMAERVLNSQFELILVFDRNKAYNRQFDKAYFGRGTETNLWDIKRERNTLTKAGFPKELVRRILKNFTKEGELILDPFMGSGTVGVVCNELNRGFVGIELDKKTFCEAIKRMVQEREAEKLIKNGEENNADQ